MRDEGCAWQRASRRTGEHGYDAQEDLFDALDGTPALGGLLVHGRVVSWGMEDGYADGAVWVD